MIQLPINFMRELKNAEFDILINNVAKIIKEEDTENDVLKGLIETIKFHSKEMAFLEDEPYCHPLTEVIDELTRKRTNLLISLRLQIEGKMLTYKENECIAAKHLYWWISKYKKNLYVPSQTTQTGLVLGMMYEKNDTKSIQDAAVLLRLDDLMDEILEVTNKVRAYIKKRTNDKAKKHKKGQDLRKAAYKDMKLFMSNLEFMFGMNPEKNFDTNIYFRLSQCVDKELKKSHTILKSRKTKRKNKQEINEVISELIDTGITSDNFTEKDTSTDLKVTDTAFRNESKCSGAQVGKTSIHTSLEKKGEIKEAFNVQTGKDDKTKSINIESTQNDLNKSAGSISDDSSQTEKKNRKGDEGKLPPISLN